ncbi:MAG: hypothetical protein A3I00_09425 [Betaproteobacteria bacterium RIFCSPLOWO2_02_FULL_64_12]|nr:MAG: hypothetical protein A3I00_09425 [Betaproteobacteria bacterium RIFCSPLOWO2_02_FULL_64_12]
MPKAIRFTQTGGPEVLRWEDVTAGDPGPGEARVRHQAVGLNLIDTYHRYALKDAAQAHRDLQARKTTGSTILLP